MLDLVAGTGSSTDATIGALRRIQWSRHFIVLVAIFGLDGRVGIVDIGTCGSRMKWVV